MNVQLNPKELPQFKDWVAIDIETSGLDPRLDQLWSVALSDGEDVWIYTSNFERIKPLLLDPEVTKVAHNMLFEYTWMMHYIGVEIQGLYDTLLVEKIISEDDGLPMSLDEVIGRYCGVFLTKDVRKTFETHQAGKPFTNEQIEYMCNDVLYLGNIVDQQIVEVNKKNLQRTVELELDVLVAVAHLEYNGLAFDNDLWQTQVGTMQVMLLELETNMRELIGKDFVLEVPAKKKGEGYIKEIPCADININSPTQLKPLFEQRFGIKTGTTNAAFLEECSEQNEFAKALLEHRKWSKRLGFDYNKFVHPVTGKVHPSYHQLGARTGRFSCSNPNLQQVPRPDKTGPNLRHVWVADSEDYVIIRADYSQQEPRVFADLCGDPAMIEACNKEDVYIEFGKHIYGREIEKGSDERYVAKQFVLATGYGAGVTRLMGASGRDEDYCITTKEIIQNTFPVMAEYAQKMYRQATMYKYVTTAIGRRRYFSVPKYTEAVNTPVQGTAADMFKLALVKVHRGLTELKNSGKIDPKTRVWNLVHDEIEVHCHKDEVDFVLPLVKQWMEEAGREICPKVLHVAEADYSYRWDK